MFDSTIRQSVAVLGKLLGDPAFVAQYHPEAEVLRELVEAFQKDLAYRDQISHLRQITFLMSGPEIAEMAFLFSSLAEDALPQTVRNDKDLRDKTLKNITEAFQAASR